jgi:hypothetical protein
MSRFRVLFTAFLGLLLLFDGVTAFRVWWYGVPKNMSMTGAGETRRLLIESIPFDASDWCTLILLVSVHALVFYVVWKAWRSSSARA